MMPFVKGPGTPERSRAAVALARPVRTLINYAEERLFGEFDAVADREDGTGEDVLAVLNEAGETDLADKYETWLAESKDDDS